MPVTGSDLLNRPLRNKWTVYKTLQTQTRFQSKQPETQLYTSHTDLVEMLKKYPLVFLKPINGTGGRGILRVERLKRASTSFRKGTITRDYSPAKGWGQLAQKPAAVMESGDGRYIVQQGIMIKLQSGRVHDYRMLVQKNSRRAMGAHGMRRPSRSTWKHHLQLAWRR